MTLYQNVAAVSSERTHEIQTVAVFGMGFVGLPLALSFAMRGCRVIGVDVLKDLVSDLSIGITNHTESHQGKPIQQILHEQLDAERFRITTSAADALIHARNIIVTVGIPVSGGELNYEPLRAACRSIAGGLQRGDTVIIRSTVVPGTTEDLVRPILESSGLQAGSDFFLAYSSERIAEGRAFHEFENVPCLVAGVNTESTLQAMDVLRIVTKAELVAGSSTKAVELSKVLENVQRDVNIAMVQEFARLASQIGVDIFEVINLANTHPRVRLLEPGPGVGGYCIPNALHYLFPKAQEHGVHLDLAGMARQINEGVPEFVVSLVKGAVAAVESSRTPQIGVVGLAMKDYSNDDRLSPAVRIAELLLVQGYQVRAFDSAVQTPYGYKVGSLAECCLEADCIVILARQNGITSDEILQAARGARTNCTIVDTRNVMTTGASLPTNLKYVRI